MAEVVRAAAGLSTEEARTLLAKFRMRGDAALRPSSSLSPGERTRAGLALLQARGVNFLVLDEPTNHLDIEAIEQLEQALPPTPARCYWSRTTGGWPTRCDRSDHRRRDLHRR